MSNAHELGAQAVAAAPPVTIVGMNLLGYPVADWAMALTAVYAFAQLVYLLPKIIERYRALGKEPQCPSDSD